MATDPLTMNLGGINKALKKIHAMSDGPRTDRRISHAMRKAAEPVLDVARARVPVDTGLLQESLTITSKKLKNGNRSVRVGPNSNLFEMKTTKTSSRSRVGLLNKIRRPSKYAHLVEYGTRHSREKPFMRPANNQEGGSKYIRVVTSMIWKSYRRLAKSKGVPLDA